MVYLYKEFKLDNNTHNSKKIKLRIKEYSETKENHVALNTSILETALHLEDSFGIRLSDDEITLEFLGTQEAMVNLVKDKLTCAEYAE